MDLKKLKGTKYSQQFYMIVKELKFQTSTKSEKKSTN